MRSAAATRLPLRQLRQCGLHSQPLVVNDRFALWELRPDADAAANPSQLLQKDRELLAALPAPPVARMLLPADVVGPNISHPFVYVPGSHARGVEDILAGDSSSTGYFALSLLPHGSAEQSHVRKPEDLPQKPAGAIATRLLLSNALVNLWDFCVEPQRTCELHEHQHPYVFINRSSGKTRNLDARLQEQGETQFAAGEFRYVDVDPTEQRCIHAFQNTGSQALHQYVIEFKN